MNATLKQIMPARTEQKVIMGMRDGFEDANGRQSRRGQYMCTAS
jgi:hypothetical protein